MMDKIISVSDLTKVFCDKSGKKTVDIKAVNSISFDVKEGEIFGFLGTNGAGKSTTIDILTTRLAPTSGRVSVSGHELCNNQQDIRKVIGCVSQKGGADTSFNTEENLMLQAKLYGMSYKEAKIKAEILIDKFQLSEIKTRKVSTYSGGQKRRLELAIGLINNPKIIFLDEPTTGLDPQSRAYFWEEIKKLKANGTTVFLTTHYLDEADSLCDTIAIMDRGLLIDVGTPSSMKKDLGDAYTEIKFFNSADMDKAKNILSSSHFVRDIKPSNELVMFIFFENQNEAFTQVVKTLSDSDVKIQSINMSQPSLSDVFLKKTGRSLREN